MDIVTGENTEILRTVCRPVESFDAKLVETLSEMERTMLTPSADNDVTGVGLAAPQVGIDARILLITLNVGTNKEHRILAMINPEIVELSAQEVMMEEGCLSLPGTFGKVTRPSKVRVRWQNEKGNQCEKKFQGWDARIFLHEFDHLEGILFTDYLKEDQIEHPRTL